MSDIFEFTQTVWSIVFVELSKVSSAFAFTVISPVSSGLSQP